MWIFCTGFGRTFHKGDKFNGETSFTATSLGGGMEDCVRSNMSIL